MKWEDRVEKMLKASQAEKINRDLDRARENGIGLKKTSMVQDDLDAFVFNA